MLVEGNFAASLYLGTYNAVLVGSLVCKAIFFYLGCFEIGCLIQCCSSSPSDLKHLFGDNICFHSLSKSPAFPPKAGFTVNFLLTERPCCDFMSS